MGDWPVCTLEHRLLRQYLQASDIFRINLALAYSPWNICHWSFLSTMMESVGQQRPGLGWTRLADGCNSRLMPAAPVHS
jgi:hypothetical protein